MLHSRLAQQMPRIVLLLIIILAAGLRLYGQNWDEGHYLHPDERFIASVSSDRVTLPADRAGDLFDPAKSPINPRRDDPNGSPQSFAYGTLPIYVQGVTSWLLDLAFDTTYGEYSNLYRVGRTLTALLDIATLVFVYLLGRRLFSEPAALIGATLYALAVLPVQLSHFFTVDPWLTAFVTASLYLSVRYLDRPTFGQAALLGIAVGCAFATKASVPSLFLPLLIAFGVSFWKSEQRTRVATQALAGGVIALAVFTLFEPYALVRRDPFIEDIRTQANIVRGIWDVPFTRQFVGLTPGAYEIRNLFAYTIGPGFFLAGVAGLVFAGRRLWRSRDLALAIPVAWVIAYVPILLITEARFLRYTLPLLPVLALVAGGLLWAATSRPGWSRTGQIVTAAVIAITAVWAFGFVSIYSSQHPRSAASEWIYDNIEPGSVLTAESWDDSLPLRLEGESNTYTLQSLDIYGDLPPEEKVNALYDTLEPVDYVVMSSDRLIYSVDNLPWRYAVQNEYYRRLLDGQLGFQLVYRVELRPEVFGIRYDDSGADESFTVYDHPRVQIFERVVTLSREEFRARLLWGVNQPWGPARYPSEQWLRLDGPVEEQSAVGDISWNRLAVDHDLLAILFWLAALEVFGLAVLPWSAVLFSQSPDRGALAARLLGILAVGWIVWFGASVGFWTASALTVAVVLVVFALACWSWYRWKERGGVQPELPSLRAYSATFGLMLAVFLPFLLFRALYPDFWQTFLGGEKPFELAYLRAVAASPEMPPYDPWFSDGVINYYYYGWHLVSTVGRLPGVGVNHAFQLAVPTFAALLAMQVALIGLMLGRARRMVAPSKRQALAAATAVIAVLFVGNLDAARQVLELRGQALDQFDFWGSTRVIDFTINEFHYFSFIWADLHPHVMSMPVVALVLGLLVSVAQRVKQQVRTSSTAGEFAVAGSMAGALSLGSVFVINAWDLPLMIAVTVAALAYSGLLHSLRLAIVLAGAGAAIVAAGYGIFLPFHANFYSIVEGVTLAESGSPLGQFLTMWGVFFIIVVAAILRLALREIRRRQSLEHGMTMLLVLGVATAGGIARSVIVGDTVAGRSSVLALAILFLVVGASSIADRPLRLHPAPLAAVSGLVLAAGFLVVSEPSAAVSLGISASAAMFAVSGWKVPARFLPWAFVVVGCLTIASTEFVYVVDDLQNGDWQRMNTVFKFYVQAWILIAVGSAVLFTRLVLSASLPAIGGPDRGAFGIIADHARPAREHDTVRDRTGFRVAGTGLAGLATIAIVLGLIYPVLATPVRLRQDMSSSPNGLTLDGYTWMEDGTLLNGTGEVISFSGDLDAINWLSNNASQTDVIVEAAIGPYRGNGARISSGTGMPAVIGWDRHQHQQRYPEGIVQRMADVRAIYNSTDAAVKIELLRRYNVRYVIVGDVERLWNTPDDPEPYASEAGLMAFESMIGSSLRLAFVSGSTRVYEVLDFPAVRPAENAVRAL
ncbi:hypothetical protein BH23CHL2_BH23CHL2_18290 [soil metagenome]